MNLKTLRKQKGKTQKEIAEYLKIATMTYCGYEIGKSEPNIDTLIKLSSYFDCSVDELIGNEKKTNSKTSPEKNTLLKTIDNLTEIECHKLNVFAQGLIMNRVAEQKQRTNNLISIINEED